MFEAVTVYDGQVVIKARDPIGVPYDCIITLLAGRLTVETERRGEKTLQLDGLDLDFGRFYPMRKGTT